MIREGINLAVRENRVSMNPVRVTCIVRAFPCADVGQLLQYGSPCQEPEYVISTLHLIQSCFDYYHFLKKVHLTSHCITVDMISLRTLHGPSGQLCVCSTISLMLCSQHHDLVFKMSSRQLGCLIDTKVESHASFAQASPPIETSE